MKSYPQFTELYDDIYKNGNMEYWNELAIEIERYSNEHSIKHINYFYHKDNRAGQCGGRKKFNENLIEIRM